MRLETARSKFDCDRPKKIERCSCVISPLLHHGNPKSRVAVKIYDAVRLDGFTATIGAVHMALGSMPPISRLALTRNSLLKLPQLEHNLEIAIIDHYVAWAIDRFLIRPKDHSWRLLLQRRDEVGQRHAAPTLLQRFLLVDRDNAGLQSIHLVDAVLLERGVVAAVMADLVEDRAFEQVGPVTLRVDLQLHVLPGQPVADLRVGSEQSTSTLPGSPSSSASTRLVLLV